MPSLFNVSFLSYTYQKKCHHKNENKRRHSPTVSHQQKKGAQFRFRKINKKWHILVPIFNCKQIFLKTKFRLKSYNKSIKDSNREIKLFYFGQYLNFVQSTNYSNYTYLKHLLY